MKLKYRAAGNILSVTAAIALGASAYAHYRPLGAGEKIAVGNSAMDDPENLKEESASQMGSPTYRSTYDPSKGKKVSRKNSTSTNTNTDRSSADQADPEL